MRKKEFCNELVNQFNYYSKKEDYGTCLIIIKLLACIAENKIEFDYYTDLIKNQNMLRVLMLYSLKEERL